VKRISFTSISVISSLGVAPWQLNVSELKRFSTGSKLGQKISGGSEHWHMRETKDENLADLLDVLLTALQQKKPSGRCRWNAIPTQR
jgi:hypothetical protein